MGSRVGVLDAAFQKQAQLTAELKKTNKADSVLKDADGKVAQELFTDQRLGAIKKLKEKLNKLEGAMERALTAEKASNEFDKLSEVLKKLNGSTVDRYRAKWMGDGKTLT